MIIAGALGGSRYGFIVGGISGNFVICYVRKSMIRRGEVRKKIYCQRCRNLCVVQKNDIAVLCVGSADFVSGPLRRNVDLRGVTSAEARNVRNDCIFYVPFWKVSIQVLRLKRFVKQSLGASFAALCEYTIRQEHIQKRKIQEGVRGKSVEEVYPEEADSEEAEVERDPSFDVGFDEAVRQADRD